MPGKSRVRLARTCLRVEDAAGLSAFYRTVMGMRPFESGEPPAWGYDPAGCLLELRDGATAPYRPGKRDLYWKIGVTVGHLDSAVAFLRRGGWPVSDPVQFRDIGYLCHLRDPAGFTIELLQRGFEGNEAPPPAGHPIGAQATLAHLTLRVADLVAARAWCEDRLGLRLMSVQPVPDLGFTLYFYAWSDEPLPNPDLASVDNREWLWSRPYTLLELQHLEDEPEIALPRVPAAGFDGLAYESDDGVLNYIAAPDLFANLRPL